MTKQTKVQKKYYVTAFYRFFDWSTELSIKEHAEKLELWCKENKINGLIVASEEGFNGTVASSEPLDKFKTHLESLSKTKITFKDSFMTGSNPFRRTKVKIRKEIVTLGKTEITPKSPIPKGVKHISPKAWHDFINENPDVQLVDVRNGFEVEMGTFTHAQNWDMNEFTEFPDLVKKSEFKKDKPVLMCCTGGIRCEKASLEMSEQGYEQVYQLDGGILNYLAEYPNEHFSGECFVFDHRVSVDQNLEASKAHALCIHCGQPSEKESFDCIQCDNESYGVCKKCWNKEDKYKTCSKNCAHHFELGHKTNRLHKDAKRIKYSN